MAGFVIGSRKIAASRIQQPANNGNRSGASPTRRTFVSASGPAIVEPDSSVFGRYVIGGVVLGMRLCSCARRGFSRIISGSAFVARAGGERSGSGSVSLRRRIACSKFSHQFGGRRLSRAFRLDRKSTRLNSSHLGISYAVFCLKK